ncbi:MAG: glycosyltransferase family 2 protein, partial [Chloroflexota bacterium]
MPPNEPRVLIVVPAKDEQATIGAVLEDMKRSQPTAHILVVDDGSIDSTVEVARSKGALTVSHETNLGVAAAIQTGRVYALNQGYDFIVFCDADGQHRPADIGAILKPLLDGKADFVIGSRELGEYSGDEALLLKLSRRFCSLAISLLALKRVTDTTSGFKGWNREVMDHFRTIYATSGKLHLGTTNDSTGCSPRCGTCPGSTCWSRCTESF